MAKVLVAGDLLDLISIEIDGGVISFNVAHPLCFSWVNFESVFFSFSMDFEKHAFKIFWVARGKDYVICKGKEAKSLSINVDSFGSVYVTISRD